MPKASKYLGCDTGQTDKQTPIKLQWKPQLRAWVQGYDDQGRWSDKRAAAAHKTVCAAQAILRDRRKAEVNAQKR